MGSCISRAPPPQHNININNIMPSDTSSVAAAAVPEPEPAPDNVSLKFQHILEAIYDAATKAQTNVQLNNIHNLFWMFPENAQGVHVPRTIPIQVEDGRTLNVPVFTIVNHKNLCIHELHIKTKLDIQMSDAPKVASVLKSVKNKKYDMNIFSGQHDTTIEFIMRVEEPTEAYNRLLRSFESKLS